MINRQAREMGTLKVALADAKAHVIEVQASKHRDIENAREDALGSMQALKDLPQELRQAHTRFLNEKKFFVFINLNNSLSDFDLKIF
jgi:hypothetical protein